jgi:hypothetical protein
MADDPNKIHIDGWFVSNQPQEYDYFKTQIERECPRKSDDEINAAILACRKAMAPTDGRAKLAACVRQRLGE